VVDALELHSHSVAHDATFRSTALGCDARDELTSTRNPDAAASRLSHHGARTHRATVT